VKQSASRFRPLCLSLLNLLLLLDLFRLGALDALTRGNLARKASMEIREEN
jgi:hypothetical protein